MQSGLKNAYDSIKAVSETDFTDDQAKFDVPTMRLLGDANWWMRRWLDRVLPRLDIEGTGGLPALDLRPLPLVEEGAPAGEDRTPPPSAEPRPREPGVTAVTTGAG
jgi:hypothetical protein